MSSHNNDAWELIHHWVQEQAPQFSTPLIPQPEPCLALWRLLELIPKTKLHITQSFKPYCDEFTAKQYATTATISIGNNTYDAIFFVPTRQRQESLGILAKSLLSLSEGGFLVFSCANAQGASGFLSRLRELVPELEALSENKCRLCVIYKKEISNTELLNEWLQEASTTYIPQTVFESTPGIYGWNKIDQGSTFLVSTLPELNGVGADFGCGYGYISHEILKNNSGISTLHLVEAESRALDCARKNLEPWSKKTVFHWLDITSHDNLSQLVFFDFIVMNPPFHEGRDTDANLGNLFIKQAASKLKPKGKLYMVANSFLAYEKTLASCFTKVTPIKNDKSFKVFHAEL